MKYKRNCLSCNTEMIIRESEIKTKKYCSKGCYVEGQKTHGMFGTRFYRIYYKMFERCKPNHEKRKHYYEKGIVVCKRWSKFEVFMKDMYKGYLEHIEKYGERQTTMDRINNNKGYSPSNCRWATYKQQNYNRDIYKLTATNR